MNEEALRRFVFVPGAVRDRAIINDDRPTVLYTVSTLLSPHLTHNHPTILYASFLFYFFLCIGTNNYHHHTVSVDIIAKPLILHYTFPYPYPIINSPHYSFYSLYTYTFSPYTAHISIVRRTPSHSNPHHHPLLHLYPMPSTQALSYS